MRAYRLAARGALAGAAIACVGAVAGIIADRADERSFVLILVVLGIAAVGFLCGYLAFRNPGRAVAAVSDAADRFAAGELGQRATIRSPATGQLTDAFNSMSGRVQALVEDGIAERARLEAVFDAATDPMIAISR